MSNPVLSWRQRFLFYALILTGAAITVLASVWLGAALSDPSPEVDDRISHLEREVARLEFEKDEILEDYNADRDRINAELGTLRLRMYVYEILIPGGIDEVRAKLNEVIAMVEGEG